MEIHKYKPVPKVTASALTGAAVVLVIALARANGIEVDAETAAALVVVFGFVAGWLKTDPARDLLKALKSLEAARVEDGAKAAVQAAADADDQPV